MIQLEVEKETMKKLKVYGKKEGASTLIASVYVKDDKVVVESDDSKVKEELERRIEEVTGKEGVPTGTGGATISVTDEGELVVEAMDPEIEEGLRKETRVEEIPGGYFHAKWEPAVGEPGSGNPIHISYVRPRRKPGDPLYMDALYWYGDLWERWDGEHFIPKKYGGYEVDVFLEEEPKDN
ncbi:hypothetical protein AKJ56_02065 [candidate division MSBL1 archaeon SCGC-AAA382N08]|uniref:Uncharacterized protein n=1 Tax=candidate division MSBL1 archaeon SCGC-AAA382N08 TaxID=1698285 RepID=A0A133VNF1_9EURY|nr:hypothetical protein AKJ56_02065 [candidate division MSBL1 archaeon SCGC-AAA382N08]